MTDEVKSVEKTEKEEGIKIYEIGYLLLSNIGEDRVGEEVTKIKSAVEDNKGQIFADEFPKMRPLAYTIYKSTIGKKVAFKEAYFGWLKFNAEADAISKIDKVLKNNENILRFILINSVKDVPVQIHRPIFNVIESPRVKKEKEKEEKPQVSVVVSDEEVDKAIEDLVIN
ncbi:MAG: 30S ribosomal protein S6 [Candidatus Paceibacterota bacterium]